MPTTWTLEAWIEHTRELRAADLRALAIAQEATEKALSLARDAQGYRDEQANNLRTQIESERGSYVSRAEYAVQHQALSDKLDSGLVALGDRFEAAVKPLAEFVAAARGQRSGVADVRTIIYAVLIVLVGIAAAVSPHIH